MAEEAGVARLVLGGFIPVEPVQLTVMAVGVIVSTLHANLCCYKQVRHALSKVRDAYSKNAPEGQS